MPHDDATPAAHDTPYLAAVLDHLPFAILLESPERRVLRTNTPFCELFGIDAPPAALVGGDCAAAAEESAALFADPQRFLDRIDEVLVRGEPVTNERLELADGRVLERGYAQVLVASGDHGHLWTYRDVTAQMQQLREYAEALDEAATAGRTKDRFLATISHEIRTPLNGIIGMLDLVQGEELGAESARMVGVALQSASALTMLLEDVLTFARDGDSAADVRLAAFDLHELGTGVRELFAARAVSVGTGIDLHVVVPAGVQVVSDVDRIRQVLVNLVSNALKYTEHGHVDLQLRIEEDPGHHERHRLMAVVHDTGPGVAPDIADRLFEPFARSSTSVAGSGLGLAICRTIADRLEGTIQHDPAATGARFVFTVPVATISVSDRPDGDDVRYASTSRRPAPVEHSADAGVLVVYGDGDVVPEGWDVQRAGDVHALARLAARHPTAPVMVGASVPDRERALDLIAMLDERHGGRRAELPAVVQPLEDGEADDAGPAGAAVSAGRLAELVADVGSVEIVAGAVRTYLGQLELRITAILDAGDDVAARASACHALASASATMGATELASACRGWEHAARDGTPADPALPSQLAALETATRAAMEAWLDAS